MFEDAEIIPKDEFESLHEIKHSQSISKDTYYLRTPYILKDFVKCKYCDSLMKPYNPGKGTPPKYRCENSSCNYKNKIICTELESIVFSKLQSISSNIDSSKLYDNFISLKLANIESDNKLYIQKEDEYAELKNTISSIKKEIIDVADEVTKCFLERSLDIYINKYSGLQTYIDTHCETESRLPTKDEFNSFLSSALEKLFDSNICSTELKRHRRLFMITLIDRIIVDSPAMKYNGVEILIKYKRDM